MKKYLLFLVTMILIISVSGCDNKESETKPDTEADMPEKSTECTFKAVVTEVNDAGIVVKPVPGSDELKSSDAIAIGKAAITDNSQPEIGDTYEIVYDGRILESYPAGLSNISNMVLVAKNENNAPISESEHVISYSLGDLAEYFTSTTVIAGSGEKVEIRTQVLYDADIHLYLDDQELEKSHSDSDYWGYSFVMPDKDVVITAKPYSKEEIWGNTETQNDEKRLLPEGDIVGITAKTLPGGLEYTYSDIIAIQNIREYFDALTLESDFPGKPEEYNGMTWELKFKYSDQSEETIYHFGNMFVRNEKGHWYKMKYEEAEKLEGILAGIEIFQLEPSDYKVQEFLDILGERPKTYDDDTCYNIVPVDISEKYGFNVFKYDMSCASYLLYDDTIYTLGESFGGSGVTAFAVADLNKDGMKELYFTYSWGSGIHRSQVGYFDMATKTVTCFKESNENHDMSFYVGYGTLMVCNAELRAKSFVDIKTTNLVMVGEVRFEDGQIRLIIKNHDGFFKFDNEIGLDANQIIKAARAYVDSDSMKHQGEIIDLDNPLVEILEVLPEFYYHVSEPSNVEGKYYKITFATNRDRMLGPIGIYLDADGTIIGLDYRK